VLIHVVHRGETIYSIARAYGVSSASIIEVSQPPHPDRLVPGQTLLIPIRPETHRPVIEINAYHEPQGTESDTSAIGEAGDRLTYLSVFSYQVKADGSLTSPRDEIALREARRYRAAPILVLTNFSAGKFSSDIAHTVLRTSSIQNKVIDEALSIMRSKGYHGINIDFEYIYPEDREHYNQFLRNLSARVKPEGLLLFTALAPKTSATQQGLLYEAHDYPAHGQIADFSVLMTYEYGWSGGPPMAVAPPARVRQVLQYATSVMPRHKIMMGMPLYGYDWTLPYIHGGQWARRVSTQEAYTIAWNHGVPVMFDQQSQSPFLHYSVSGTNHVVWFEDARSMRAKFNLIKEFDLRGGSYWVLGSPFPQNWSLLGSTFRISKIL
jgi:spore germination protein